MENEKILNSNIPTLEQYSKLTSGAYFNQFLDFSNAFLKRNQKFLIEYFGKWGEDPLNQWSRKWEYPFTHFQISQITEKLLKSFDEKSQIDGSNHRDQKIEVLDAGSGITFFPYYLENIFPNIEITAFDYDESYIPVFRKLNESENSIIEFVHGKLDELPFSDKSFDIIYCISTLEHTSSYEAIIKEFHRVLKPEGTLILTFDVSELETTDIPIPKANQLHNSILNYFDAFISNKLNPISDDIFQKSILTSKWAYDVNPNLIWKHNLISKVRYFLGHLVKRHSIRFFPDNLTVFCEVYRKK